MPLANRNLSQIYNYDIATLEGTIAGHRFFDKFGHNGAVGTSYEDVWQGGGVKEYATVTGATATTIVSTNNNDKDTDTGAIEVYVQGLDPDWIEVGETITLTGTTPATLTTQFQRVLRAKVISAGSSGHNEGSINISIGSVLDNVIGSTENQTQLSHMAVPANNIMYMKQLACFTDASKIMDIKFSVRNPDSVWQVKGLFHITGSFQDNLILAIPEKSDVRIQAKGASGSSDVSVDYLFTLVNYGEEHYGDVATFVGNGGDFLG